MYFADLIFKKHNAIEYPTILRHYPLRNKEKWPSMVRRVFNGVKIQMTKQKLGKEGGDY